MRLYVCPNGFTIEQDELAKECLRTLVSLGYVCAVSERRFYDDFHGQSSASALSDSDCIVPSGFRIRVPPWRS